MSSQYAACRLESGQGDTERAMKPKILFVEDDANLRELLRYNLDSEGFETEIASDGEAGLAKAREEGVDLILLDWMLPRLSGIEICERLKRDPKTSHIPIIMLTVRNDEEDRLRGLDAGADDYVAKPFSPKELFARINAILRRSSPGHAARRSDGVLTYGDLILDPQRYTVLRGARSVHLGPTEFRLLRHLMENPARVFTREQLVMALWGEDNRVHPRTIDQHIRRVRRALNAPGEEDPIRTVRAAGYSLDVATPGSLTPTR